MFYQKLIVFRLTGGQSPCDSKKRKTFFITELFLVNFIWLILFSCKYTQIFDTLFYMVQKSNII